MRTVFVCWCVPAPVFSSYFSLLVSPFSRLRAVKYVVVIFLFNHVVSKLLYSLVSELIGFNTSHCQ